MAEVSKLGSSITCPKCRRRWTITEEGGNRPPIAATEVRCCGGVIGFLPSWQLKVHSVFGIVVDNGSIRPL